MQYYCRRRREYGLWRRRTQKTRPTPTRSRVWPGYILSLEEGRERYWEPWCDEALWTQARGTRVLSAFIFSLGQFHLPTCLRLTATLLLELTPRNEAFDGRRALPTDICQIVVQGGGSIKLKVDT
ncbi:hypothetical protein PM082_021752 [Marasmius tenuissimus]|nr:hypothetical protein PM082_021752 [Marasmius tenuissimus]